MSVRVTFDTPGTYRWICPDGVTWVDVEAVGAESGDGQPGEVVRGRISVKPRTAYDLTVGEGGIVLAGRFDTGTGAVMAGGGGGGGTGSGGGVPVVPGGAGGGSGALGKPGRVTLTFDELGQP